MKGISLKNNNVVKIMIILILFVMAFVACIQSPQAIGINTGYSGTDSSVFRTVAMYMDSGMMPYKDIFDHKGPLLYIYNWIGWKISQTNGIWFIELVSMFATTFFLYKIARLFTRRIWSLWAVFAALAPLSVYFQGGNFTEEYAMPFIALSLYLFTDYFINNRISNIRLIVCGACFGAVLMLRPNMISVWFIFCIAVLVKLLKERDLKNLFRFLLFFLVGALAVVIPILIWLGVNGALRDMVQEYILFSFKYSSDEVRASLGSKYAVFSSFLNNTLVLCALLCSAWLIIRRKDIFHVSYFICIFFSLVLICISGQYFLHYGMVLIPLMVYPFSMV